VVIFSDNVPLDEERTLKELARSKGLLCMGPDCGVANINGVALLTGSAVRKGPIGIIGASGSGTQQVTAIADREEIGVSQAIGVGGKDLLDPIGGIGMLSAIDMLEADPETKVLVLISRVPGTRTLPLILDRIRRCAKPVVVYFIGGDAKAIAAAGGVAAHDLDDAAYKAIDLAQGRPPRAVSADEPDDSFAAATNRERRGRAASQKYLRGLFCGGTFAEEAMAVLTPIIGAIHSNTPLRPDLKLANSQRSREHTIVDYGDEEFTVGRPHPVIDPEPRRQGLLREGTDPEVAVILLDFILSHAVHPNPAGALVPSIREIKARATAEGRSLSIVASVCGTEADPQRLSAQERMLREAGVWVVSSNARAARLAGRLVKSDL
jgi:FdrA protein